LVRITGADLSLFEFDYDCAWYGFFLSADEVIYGRYGGRDAKSDDGRLSLAGLKYAAEKALAQHKARAGEKPPARGKPVFVENFAAAKARKRQECIHCHQVNEFRRADEKAAGNWSRDSLWVYPLPENVGITLEIDRGDVVQSVATNSLAAKIGMKTGDMVTKLNGYTVASLADAQYALHKGPKSGGIPIEWKRGSDTVNGKLEVADGWRKTNITWRSSLLEILPSLPVSGDDLTAAEKKALGLPEARAAFRQDKFVHSTLKAVGLQKGDVIVGLDGKGIEGMMDDYLAFVRREHLVGDTVTLDVLRDGKPVEIKLTLK
jgi:membrane-associated protease RseP (regulator of RpoE activity)